MHQEAEQGMWKSVLGALGVVSVLLTIVSNLVFSPDNLLKRGGSTTGERIAAKSVELNTDPLGADSQPASAVQQAVEPPSRPAPEVAAVDHLSPRLTEAIGEPAPEFEEEPAIEHVLVAAQAPVAEQGQQLEPVVVASQLQLEEPATVEERAIVSDVPQKAAETIFEPPQGPTFVAETDSGVAVAAIQPGRDGTQPSDRRGYNLQNVAIPDALSVFEPALSHHDRRVLRKIAHLEKKRNRLLQETQPTACR